MTKAVSKKPTLNDLEKLLGSKERVLFYLTWIKHNRNATKAYEELHPGVTGHSASVLGSKMLSNIDIRLIANQYGLTHEKYFEMIKEGLDATKAVSAISVGKDAGSRDVDFIDVPDHQTRLKYHDKLGKILEIEGEKQPQINIGIQNIIDEQRKKYEI